MLKLIILLTALMTVNCSYFEKDSSSPPPAAPVPEPSFSNPTHYFGKAKKIVIEVAYEPNAVPFTGPIGDTIDAWAIFRENATALMSFNLNQPNIEIPSQLENMTPMPDQMTQSWSIAGLESTSRTYLPRENTSEVAYFKILFVNGLMKAPLSNSEGILGVNLTGTNIIVIFKDVVENRIRSQGTNAKFVEQFTLVHEFGHAIGLVNNGIPANDTHYDGKDGAHCTRNDCVMYWANEGFTELYGFMKNYLENESLIMFGDSCLDDIATFTSQL